MRRLERTFHIVYGRDNLSGETREAFLYGQLQDSWRTDLMQIPDISRACMAAQNEERKAEMEKRKEYRNDGHTDRNKRGSYHCPFNGKRDGGGPGKFRQPITHESSQCSSRGEIRACCNCAKQGHLAQDCRAPKTESQGNSPRGRQLSSSAKQVTSTQTDTVNTNSEDPLKFLQPDSEENRLI